VFVVGFQLFPTTKRNGFTLFIAVRNLQGEKLYKKGDEKRGEKRKERWKINTEREKDGQMTDLQTDRRTDRDRP
jgi:hypothetical protein